MIAIVALLLLVTDMLSMLPAHTTQFTEIGWMYLKHGRGVEKLAAGGSVVTLASTDYKHFTIIIETMVSSLP